MCYDKNLLEPNYSSLERIYTKWDYNRVKNKISVPDGQKMARFKDEAIRYVEKHESLLKGEKGEESI